MAILKYEACMGIESQDLSVSAIMFSSCPGFSQTDLEIPVEIFRSYG